MTLDALQAGLEVEEVELPLRHRATGRDVPGFVHRARQLRDLLLAFGPLALQAGRRRLGWSAIVVAAIVLDLIPVSLDNLAQMANLLWLLWIVAASVALAGRGPERVGVIAPARS